MAAEITHRIEKATSIPPYKDDISIDVFLRTNKVFVQGLENVMVVRPTNGRFDGRKERGMEQQAVLTDIEQV